LKLLKSMFPNEVCKSSIFQTWQSSVYIASMPV
jgi:hypothetical protein